MAYTVESVVYSDAPGLTETMMRAMSQDPHYTLLLSGATTEELIKDSGLRMPYNLCNNRSQLRHQKVVHTETGQIVGYARWELPETEEAKNAWLDTQMPAATETQRKSFKEDYELTEINGKRKIFNYEMGDYTGPPLGRAYRELEKNGGPYLGRCLLSTSTALRLSV